MKNKQTQTNLESALLPARHLRIWLMLGSVIYLVLMIGSVWAATSAIEGIVKDPKGQPVKGADIRIEATGGGKLVGTVKTDASGRYTSAALPTGTYRVTLVVNGVMKASINNTKTKLGVPTELNFDLKATSASQASAPAKKKSYVWVPPTTGSHLGGRWVEVDDNRNLPAGSLNVKKGSAEAVRQMQMQGGDTKVGGQ
jgi:hypothetical protein